MSLTQLLDAAEAKLAPDQLEAISSFELEHFLAETKVSEINHRTVNVFNKFHVKAGDTICYVWLCITCRDSSTTN